MEIEFSCDYCGKPCELVEEAFDYTGSHCTNGEGGVHYTGAYFSDCCQDEYSPLDHNEDE